jgi:hypothetical protein
MPDLDQIKQGEQGARDRHRGFPRTGRAIPPAGRTAPATTSNPLVTREGAGSGLLQIRCKYSKNSRGGAEPRDRRASHQQV